MRSLFFSAGHPNLATTSAQAIPLAILYSPLFARKQSRHTNPTLWLSSRPRQRSQGKTMGPHGVHRRGCLDTAWPSLSLWSKLRVAWTLHGHVRQLRRVKVSRLDIPGPIDGSGNPLLCIGTYFNDDGAGPFVSYGDMSAWVSSLGDLFFDDTAPLVLTSALGMSDWGLMRRFGLLTGLLDICLPTAL